MTGDELKRLVQRARAVMSAEEIAGFLGCATGNVYFLADPGIKTRTATAAHYEAAAVELARTVEELRALGVVHTDPPESEPEPEPEPAPVPRAAPLTRAAPGTARREPVPLSALRVRLTAAEALVRSTLRGARTA